jgi:hypothetical protein
MEEAHVIVVLISEKHRNVWGADFRAVPFPMYILEAKFDVWTCHNMSQGQENFSSLFLDNRSMSESDSHHGTAVRTNRSHMDLEEVRPFFREFLVFVSCRDQGSRECDCCVLDARVTFECSPTSFYRIRTHAPRLLRAFTISLAQLSLIYFSPCAAFPLPGAVSNFPFHCSSCLNNVTASNALGAPWSGSAPPSSNAYLISSAPSSGLPYRHIPR